MLSSEEEKTKMRGYLEEQGIVSEIIDEFFASYDQLVAEGGPKAGPVPGGTGDVVVMLREQAAAETDWRKKAALNAAIISHKIANDLY